MNEAKFKALHGGLSAQAKRVYEAVPIKDQWNTAQIIIETRRLHPSMREQRTILGCLDTLVRSGLVVEPERGYFRREFCGKPRQEKPPPVPATPVTQEAPVQDKKPAHRVTVDQASPMEKISHLQSMVGKIMADVKLLSDAIETVAIEVEMQFSERDAESQKLKQLQSLLKGLV